MNNNLSDKDREMFLEVLFALNGNNAKGEKQEIPCQQNCQPKPQILENTRFLIRY